MRQDEILAYAADNCPYKKFKWHTEDMCDNCREVAEEIKAIVVSRVYDATRSLEKDYCKKLDDLMDDLKKAQDETIKKACEEASSQAWEEASIQANDLCIARCLSIEKESFGLIGFFAGTRKKLITNLRHVGGMIMKYSITNR